MFSTGLSKLSYVSEDVLSGIDTILQGGYTKQAPYIEMGKARDVCMNSTAKFQRKISGGAVQIALSRYSYYLMSSWRLMFWEKLCLSFTLLQFYTSAILTVACTFSVFVARDLLLLVIFIIQ